MTPSATLTELIDAVQSDTASDDLDKLTRAARTSRDLQGLADGLLEHFVVQSRRDGRSWSEISAALGVSKQAVHRRFCYSPEVFERLTPRVTAVIELSEWEARRLGHHYVGTEHILLSLLVENGGLAARVLESMGITAKRIRAEIRGIAGSDREVIDGRIPFTYKIRKAIERSQNEALAFERDFVGTEHLLLGLQRDPEDSAAKTLSALGVSYEATHERLLELLGR